MKTKKVFGKIFASLACLLSIFLLVSAASLLWTIPWLSDFIPDYMPWTLVINFAAVFVSGIIAAGLLHEEESENFCVQVYKITTPSGEKGFAMNDHNGEVTLYYNAAPDQPGKVVSHLWELYGDLRDEDSFSVEFPESSEIAYAKKTGFFLCQALTEKEAQEFLSWLEFHWKHQAQRKEREKRDLLEKKYNK